MEVEMNGTGTRQPDEPSPKPSNGALEAKSGMRHQLGDRVELVPVGEVAARKGNARFHSRKQIRQIADSIQAFGFNNPILVDEKGEILAGHGRLEAAKVLGLKEVPTLRISLSLRRKSEPICSPTTGLPNWQSGIWTFLQRNWGICSTLILQSSSPASI